MKRKRSEGREEEGGMKGLDIVWQNPSNPPQPQDYIFLNGNRYVKPYYFEFICHVKKRWAGKTIVDFFSQEFRGRPYQYYVSAVQSGRIQVDGQLVTVSYTIKSSQKISHFVHRHEPPVIAHGVLVLHKEADVVTVCKPASVPVHPCGQYRKNTVLGILESEHGLAPLFPVHRLDRLVSGLLILARNASKADIFRQQIEGGMVHKKYIAKVVGVFPEDEVVVNANVNYNAREGRSTVEVGDSSDDASLKGKAACTKFTRIRTNGTQSIVLCEPITGRTHQIRVHLQYTGHPIANDTLYLSEHVGSCPVEGTNFDESAYNSPRSSISNTCCSENEEKPCWDFTPDPMCTNCPSLAPKGYDENQEGLWLHCFRYSGPGWDFECPFPDWASLT